VLAVIACLAGGAPADLADIACGIDRRHLTLVLAAIAHAGGSHQHSGIQADADGLRYLVRLDSLHPWPAPVPNSCRDSS
jgi:hypothetical protein